VAIYTAGQTLTLTFNIKMKVLRAFAFQDIIYYIMLIDPETAVRGKDGSPVYAVFRHDDTTGNIPVDVNEFADELVRRENLLGEP